MRIELSDVLMFKGMVSRADPCLVKTVTPSQSPSVMARAINFIAQSSRKIFRMICLMKSPCGFRSPYFSLPTNIVSQLANRYFAFSFRHRFCPRVPLVDQRDLHSVEEELAQRSRIDVPDNATGRHKGDQASFLGRNDR